MCELLAGGAALQAGLPTVRLALAVQSQVGMCGPQTSTQDADVCYSEMQWMCWSTRLGLSTAGASDVGEHATNTPHTVQL